MHKLNTIPATVENEQGELRLTGTKVGDKFGLDVNIVGGGSGGGGGTTVIQGSPTTAGGADASVTTTTIADKRYLDVLASVVLSALEDNVEIRKMAMKKAVDEASATVTYIGEAALGSGLGASVWRIKRLTVSGTVTIAEWAGTGVFDQVWNDRASLTYN